MKTFYLTSMVTLLSITFLSAQLIEAEGNIKLDNTLEICDDSSGTSEQVGILMGSYLGHLNQNNGLTLANTTNFSNTFADISISSSDHIYLLTNGTPHLSVGPSGLVGIGTVLPDKSLHVTDDIVVGGGSTNFGSASEYLRLAAQSENWYVGALNEATEAESDFIIGRSSGNSTYFQIENGGDIGMGTSNPIARLHLEDDNHQFVMRNGIDATNTWYVGASAPTWIAGDHKLVFDDDSNSSAPVLCLNGTEEAVSIGTSYTPPGFKLAVNGSIITEEVVVELREDWPDYVFHKNYHLMPLREVKESIEENGHLPGIPSAAEIKENGLELGVMQKKMMQKIEELMLHMIKLDEDNAALRHQISSLKEAAKS